MTVIGKTAESGTNFVPYPFPNRLSRRLLLSMKSKQLVLLPASVLLVSLLGGLSGCDQPDNPKMVEAPPPAAPKPKETAPPKIGGKVKDFGAMPKYKAAMEKQFSK